MISDVPFSCRQICVFLLPSWPNEAGLLQKDEEKLRNKVGVGENERRVGGVKDLKTRCRHLRQVRKLVRNTHLNFWARKSSRSGNRVVVATLKKLTSLE